MAEATGLRNNALPYPIYGVPFGVAFPILDADGDLVTAASTPDSEVSKNGDTFADCTNEATEIATGSGMYYLLLTGTEMTADVVSVIVKNGTAGAKTTSMVLYPRKLVSLRAGTSQAGAAGTITLDSGASAIDDYYNGCVIVGVLDGATEARVITDYVGSTKVASVTPNWNTTPDSDDTFTIYLPEGRQVTQADVVAYGATAGTFSSGRPEVNTTHAAGTAWGSGAITAGSIAADAITAAKIADGAIDANTFAAGAITASAIAADAIGASELAADAVTEIQSGLATSAALATVATYIDTEIADIQARLPAALVGGRMDSNMQAAANGVITAAVIATDAVDADALSADALAEIKAQIVAALITDTYAEPGQGAPAATASIKDKIGYLYKGWRNKLTQTNSQYSLYADDAATIDQKATVIDDGSTFTRGEVASGP
jgi:hypothetical protein